MKKIISIALASALVLSSLAFAQDKKDDHMKSKHPMMAHKTMKKGHMMKKGHKMMKGHTMKKGHSMMKGHTMKKGGMMKHEMKKDDMKKKG